MTPNLIVVGLSHHETPLAQLEGVTFDDNKRALALRELLRRKGVLSGFILSTCNRVEIYVLADHELAREQSLQFFTHWCAHSDPLKSHVYLKEGDEAVAHLFGVAASIDSMIPGEAQILGQVKKAYEEILELKASHPVFDRLLRKTFSVAKRVRHETAIASQAVSLAYAAVTLAKKIFADLRQSKVMLLGTGEMGELAARHLVDQGIAELQISNRSYDAAVAVAKELAASVIPFNLFLDHLKDVDIVIAATSARHFIIQKQHIASIMSVRHNRPLFLIDIAVPRNIEPSVHQLENVYLYNIEDLQRLIQKNLVERQREVLKAKDIIHSELQQYIKDCEQQRFHTTIALLQKKIAALVLSEMDRALRKLEGELNAEQLAILQRTAESVIDKIVQQPARYLKLTQDPQLAEILIKVFSTNAVDKETEDENQDSHRHPR